MSRSSDPIGLLSIPRTDYHADPCSVPSLSSSIIFELLRSPKHAWLSHPKLGGGVRDDDVRMSLGTIAHSILLEGDESSVVVIEADDWRTKAAREARDAAWAEGKNPILAGKMADVRAMVTAAREFIGGNLLLEPNWTAGLPEQSLFWQEGDVYCRALLDKLDVNGFVIFDYKTTANAHPESWARTQLVSMGYDIQAAWYRRGVQAVFGGTEPEFCFLVQEISPPYACSWVACSPAMLAIANKKIDHAIALWQQCLASNEWPAYPNHVLFAEPLPWQEAAWNERISLEQMAKEVQ